MHWGVARVFMGRPENRRRPQETAGESGRPQETQMNTMDTRKPKVPQENQGHPRRDRRRDLTTNVGDLTQWKNVT